LLTVIGLYNGLPPAAQEAVQAVLSGHWQDITLGSLIPLAGLVWSQIMSFRATVRPQVVTPRGEKVALEQLPPAEQRTVTATVESAPRTRTILEALSDKLNASWRR